jgi:hypothetical protein
MEQEAETMIKIFKKYRRTGNERALEYAKSLDLGQLRGLYEHFTATSLYEAGLHNSNPDNVKYNKASACAKIIDGVIDERIKHIYEEMFKKEHSV